MLLLLNQRLHLLRVQFGEHFVSRILHARKLGFVEIDTVLATHGCGLLLLDVSVATEPWIGMRNPTNAKLFVLALQAIFFAHGGLTTLGVNALTLGVLGPLTAAGLWRLFQRVGLASKLSLGLACGLADLSVYVADAVVLGLGLSDVAAPMTTFTAVLFGFAPVQVPLAILEAVASVGIVQLLASRRPDLLPHSLGVLRDTRVPSSASVLFLLLALGPLGCAYEGIDGTVFGAMAESAGRPPTDSLLDLSQGEVGLAMTIIVLFGLGFVAGRTWERLLGGGRDAPRR